MLWDINQNDTAGIGEVLLGYYNLESTSIASKDPLAEL